MMKIKILALAMLLALPQASGQTTQATSHSSSDLSLRAGSGVSGPGGPFSIEGRIFKQRQRPNAPAVQKGLVPNIKPLLDLHIRDTVIRLGGDGNYYMTGSTGDDIWLWNEGVELWRSPDLQNWDYLGVVWRTLQDGTWERTPQDLHGKQVVTIWAPELHYIRSQRNYFICLSMAPGGISLLKSATGKPEGPYVNCVPGEGKLRGGGIDATLFEDDDGQVYFVNGGAGSISRMKPDMSGFAETRKVTFLDPDHDPTHHAKKCEPRGMNDIGHEGAVLFKANGKYYLGAADSYEGRYSTCLTISDNIWGPYRMRFEAIPGAGGCNYFKDKLGNWWTAYFGNDNQQPWREMPGIIRIDFAPDGRIVVAKDQPVWNLLPMP